MAKNKNIKRYNKNAISYDPNIYDWGGDLMKGLGFGDGKTLKDAFNLKETFSGANVGNMLKSGLLGSAGDAIGGLGSKLISGGLDSGAGKAITGIGSTIGGAVGAINPLFGAAVKGISGILGGATNALFGSKLNEENIQLVQSSNNQLANTSVTGNNYNDVESQLKNQNFGIDFNKGFVGKDGVFSNKAENKYKELKAKQELGRASTMLAYNNGFNNIGNQNYLNLLARQQALGGPLFTHGSNFNNGVILIDEGGTHEENPYEGVQMGIDEQGIPNLVEEGEVVWNDYVFSNRLKPSKTMKKKYKLQGKTFADAARNAQKESEERPNDPISKRGLDAALTTLAMLQESKRSKEGLEGQYKYGGEVNRFDWGGFPNMYKLAPYASWVFDTSFSNNRRGTTATTKVRKGSTSNKGEIDKSLIPTELDVAKLFGDYEYKGKTLDNTKKMELQKIEDPLYSKADDYEEDSIPTYKEASVRHEIPNNWWRFAPVVGSGMGVFSDLMGWTNKPDYTNAERIESSTRNLPTVEFKPIGNYLSYKPDDRKFITNEFLANAAAGDRAILNTSSPARNAALLAKRYNDNTSYGKLINQLDTSAFDRYVKTEDFNRGTNMTNSEGFLKAAMANKANDELRMKSALAGAQMRDQIDARSSAARAANLTGFFNNLGAIGTDNLNRKQLQMLIDAGVFGTLPTKASKGGRIRRKKGLTY